MNARVLFVDDEPNVLDGIRRQLRKKVDIKTATSGCEGLQIIQDEPPFAVVVADMRMPHMNGAEFLKKVRDISPDSVRIILSGQAELETTIEAVNNGHIFRFLTKPCPAEELSVALDTAIEQYRLVRVEKELLQQTLSGAVKTLTEILGMINPAAHSKAARIQNYAARIAEGMNFNDNWQFHLACMLSQIGCITLPDDTLSRVYAGQDLSDEEQAIYCSHPDIAGNLLASIPRLEGVAKMISGQFSLFDCSSMPEDIHAWSEENTGAAILHLAVVLDDRISRGESPGSAVEALSRTLTGFPDAFTSAIRSIRFGKTREEHRSIHVSQLEIGMTMDENLMSNKGMRLLPRGQEITRSILVRLRSISEGIGIKEPFRVKVPGYPEENPDSVTVASCADTSRSLT